MRLRYDDSGDGPFIERPCPDCTRIGCTECDLVACVRCGAEYPERHVRYVGSQAVCALCVCDVGLTRWHRLNVAAVRLLFALDEVA